MGRAAPPSQGAATAPGDKVTAVLVSFADFHKRAKAIGARWSDIRFESFGQVTPLDLMKWSDGEAVTDETKAAALTALESLERKFAQKPERPEEPTPWWAE